MAQSTSRPKPVLVASDGRLADNIVYFARALRKAGMRVGPAAVKDAIEAVLVAGIGTRDDFYWTLHSVLVTRHGKPVVALVPAADVAQLARLRAAGPEKGLASLAGGWEGSEELAELIRPAGYYQVKARRLRNLLKFVVEEFDGSLEAMFNTSLDTLRDQLLSIHGIGPETADAILLYAGGLPTFVVDTYTHRILARHGWIGYDAGYHDIKRYPNARLVPGLLLFRWDAPLFFANSELFHQKVKEAIANSKQPLKRILITAEPVTSIDVTSADMLVELEQNLRETGIELRFAEMKDPVKDKLKRFEILDTFGASNFYPTIGAAVDAYLEEHKVEWKP